MHKHLFEGIERLQRVAILLWDSTFKALIVPVGPGASLPIKFSPTFLNFWMVVVWHDARMCCKRGESKINPSKSSWYPSSDKTKEIRSRKGGAKICRAIECELCLPSFESGATTRRQWSSIYFRFVRYVG